MLRKPTSKSARSTSNKNTKKNIKTLKLACGDDAERPTKKQRVGFTLSNPPVFDLTKDDAITPTGSQSPTRLRLAKLGLQSQQPSVDAKGKGKETRIQIDDEDVSLWVDKYEPTSEAELAVHKRKIEDVRRWLLEAFEDDPSAKLRKYRRVLALTGPAGTAKTSTLRVLSRELDFEILEWRNSMSERGPSAFTSGELLDDEPGLDTETLFDKFQAFLTRAMTCNSIFAYHNGTQGPPSGSFMPSHSQTQPFTQRSRKRQLVLLEDLPNLLHQPTQVRFQAALRSVCLPASHLSGSPGPPIVIVLSDSGLRAEQPGDDTWDGASTGRRWNRNEVLDIRNVLGPELLTSPYVTRIGFNPIAPTLMTKALQALLASHFGSLKVHGRAGRQPTREVIDVIVDSSNGDIRSAIMALQFACAVDLPTSSTKSKDKVGRKNVGDKKRRTNVRAVLEAVTRREQSLVLFHLLGKILYNKRKFDPPASRLSARDAAKERELDVQLTDPPPLPEWLSHHNRKTSRVCIEALAAESPIDSSLLGMYTHQNYIQFCTDIDQCDGICEGLSLVDCTAGAQSTNSPYAFPTLALSTLHALPTPVPRRGQNMCKPAWFDAHTKELEAFDAVGDIHGWLAKDMIVGSGADDEASSMSVGKWTHTTVATELGGWLRALDRCNCDTGFEPAGTGPYPRPPQTHYLFSHLPWSLGTVGGDTLDESEDGGGEDEEGRDEEINLRLPGGMQEVEERKGWLEDDDIEDAE